MLSPKRESLAGKLLLSSALVAVSLAYGWWQTRNAERPALAMAPMPLPHAPKRLVPVPHGSATTPPAPTETGTPDAGSGANNATGPAAAAPPKSLAIAGPQAIAPSVAPATPEPQPQQNNETPAPSLTTQQAMQMYLPTEGDLPPLPLVTGTPEPGAMVPVAAGLHLADGDYVSDRHGLMWGDLRIRISIQGGLITGVQALQYPDHRSQSLYLSQMALPILASEAIKSQKAQVDIVSSATDTSYTFQDAVADAIAKATRG